MNICISGKAETIFKTSYELKGFKAWRRIIAYIDHGKDIQSESMRVEMRALNFKQTKHVESVPNGIAEFELKIKEYVSLGGL